ncbi:unnamed protein product [Diamesa hyperborea]
MKNTLINRGLIVRLVLTVAALSFIIYLFNFSVNRNTNILLENVIKAEIKLEEKEKLLKENEVKLINKTEATTVSKLNVDKISTTVKIVTIKDIIGCNDRDYRASIVQIGDYWALKNYVRADFVHCHETITYTTHSDFTFLENVIPLLERWEAPLSIALYAPGSDFDSTLSSIMYLRNCNPQGFLVQQYATFHIFFDNKYFPLKSIPSKFEDIEKEYICPESEPFSTEYKQQNNLTFPINVLRNVARRSALTHFVFASDIELYPNVGLVDTFLDLIMRNPSLVESGDNNAFFLPVFEIQEDQKIPKTKYQLQKLFREKKAQFFHKKVCSMCHSVPKDIQWISTAETPEMTIYASTKRQFKYRHWEPFFIGTNNDPGYDERLTWEGKFNKMTQAYTMCLQDYNFLGLSNAFMVHKPGIKTIQEAIENRSQKKTIELVRNYILPQIDSLYGKRKNCRMF